MAEPVGPDEDGRFRFLHAADLHIDSPLRGLSRYPGAPVEELRGATRRAFENLVDAALEHGVAFVLLAGDLFDGDWRDFDTGLWFNEQLLRLTRQGILVFVLRGNHDAASVVTKNLRLPQGVRRFREDAPESIQLDALGVTLHGQGFADREAPENLARTYPDAEPGRLNVGVLHTSLAGSELHDTYAPCTRADLESKGYDYWALGHVHERAEIASGDPWIVYSGNLQGRHARELGPKGASLVTARDGAIESVEPLVLDVVRWARVDVDLGGASRRSEVDVRLMSALEAAADGAGERLLAARVVFSGRTALDGALRSEGAGLVEEVRARAQEVDRDVWVEKVVLGTSDPAAATGARAAGILGLADTVRTAELDADELEALAADLEPLAHKLPKGARELYDPGQPSTLAEALDPARRLLAALLEGRAEEDEAEDDA